MQIRFTKFTPTGTLQFQPGELIDLPAELAQANVDAGNAVTVPKAEAATLRFENTPTLPIPRPVTKKFFKGRR